MNNEELEKKIENLLHKEIEYVVVCGSSVKNVCIEHIADALIAAGFGYVKEAEHRAEKEEKLKNQYCRALLNLARRYVVKTNMTLPHGNEPHSRSTDIEMLALYIMANECEQAKKELAEEREDDK